MVAGRPCRVCAHPSVDAINNRLLAGDPVRVVAAAFGLKPDSLHRHRTNHLQTKPVRPAEVGRAKSELAGTIARRVDLDELLNRLEGLYRRLDGRISTTTLPVAVEAAAIKELRSLIGDVARLAGLDRPTPAAAIQVNVGQPTADPAAVAQAILAALGPGAVDELAGRLLSAADA